MQQKNPAAKKLRNEVVSGIFEGYLEKRYNKLSVHMIYRNTHKKYFMLNLDDFTFKYFKKAPTEHKGPHKKMWHARDIQEVSILKIDPKSPIKWKTGFKVHFFDKDEEDLHLFAFSAFDREIWVKAFSSFISKARKAEDDVKGDPVIKDWNGMIYKFTELTEGT